jgi:hypothetical protein
VLFLRFGLAKAKSSTKCNYLNLIELKLKKKVKCHSLIPLEAFQVLNSYLWLLAALVDSIDVDFGHHTKFFSAPLFDFPFSSPSYHIIDNAFPTKGSF